MNIRKILSLILFIILWGSIISCDSNEYPKNDKFKQLLFGDRIHSDENKNPKTINFVIDASQSIIGFLQNNNGQFYLDNDYIKTIQEIVQNTPTKIGINFFELKDKISPIRGDLKAQLMQISDPRFFNGVKTNISSIFSFPDILDTNSITFLFSDLIHSMNDNNSRSEMILFSRELRDRLNNDNYFGIFGKKISFNGKYYIECSRNSGRNSNRVLMLNGIKRPYFCLVFGKSHFSKFIQNMLEPFWDNSFEFNADFNLSPKYIKTDKISTIHQKPIINHTSLIGIRKDGNIRFKINSNLESGLSNNWDIKLNTIEAKIEGDIVKVRKNISAKLIQIDSDKVTNHRKSKSEKSEENDEDESRDGDESENHKKSKSPISVNQKINLAAKQSNNIYELQINDRVNELIYVKLSFIQNLPTWIKEWSTNCDDNSIEALKVYQLETWLDKYVLNDLDDNKKNLGNYYLVIRRD